MEGRMRNRASASCSWSSGADWSFFSFGGTPRKEAQLGRMAREAAEREMEERVEALVE